MLDLEGSAAIISCETSPPESRRVYRPFLERAVENGHHVARTRFGATSMGTMLHTCHFLGLHCNS